MKIKCSAVFLILALISIACPLHARALEATVIGTLPEERSELDSYTFTSQESKTARGIMAKGEGEPFIVLLSGLKEKSFRVRAKNMPETGWAKLEISQIGWVGLKYSFAKTGKRADPLYPVSLGQPVAALDEKVLLWVRIFVSRDAPSIKSLDFSLEFDSGGEAAEISVHFRIADLRLPRELPLTIQAALLPKDSVLGRRYSEAEVLGAYSFLARYGINAAAGATNIPNLNNPGAFYADLFAKTGIKKSRFTFQAIQQDLKQCSSERCSSSLIEGWKLSTRNLIDAHRNLFMKYPDKFLIKAWDEPKKGVYPAVRDLYLFLNTFKLPFLTEITAPPGDDIKDIASIYIPQIEDIDIKSAREAQSKGKEVWFYANLMHSLRRPYHTMRNIGWLESSLGLNGYHFWCMNCWNRDPYTAIHGNARKDNLGTGYFVYPGTSSEIFNSSIRLEMFREGLEDYLIIKQARELHRPDIDRKIDQYFSANYALSPWKKNYLNNPASMHDELLEMVKSANQ